MSDFNVSQDPGQQPCGSRDGLDVPATAALAPMAAREWYARIIEPRLADSAWIDSFGELPGLGDETCLEYVRRIALAKADAILADQAELIAQRAALVEAVQGLEWSCEQLAATRDMATYDAMIAAGQADAMIALDNARRTARALLTSIQAGGAS